MPQDTDTIFPSILPGRWALGVCAHPEQARRLIANGDRTDNGLRTIVTGYVCLRCGVIEIQRVRHEDATHEGQGQ